MSLQGMGQISRANPSQDLADRTVTPTYEVCQLPPSNFKPQLSLVVLLSSLRAIPATLSATSPSFTASLAPRKTCVVMGRGLPGPPTLSSFG